MKAPGEILTPLEADKILGRENPREVQATSHKNTALRDLLTLDITLFGGKSHAVLPHLFWAHTGL